MGITDEQMIERLHRAYDAFNRGDFDAALTIAHPDVVLKRAGGQPELRGADALRAWMEPDAFDSQLLKPADFEIAGNKVLMHVRGTARGAGSGIEMQADGWSIWTFDDDGNVVRIATFLAHEEDEARRALGGD